MEGEEHHLFLVKLEKDLWALPAIAHPWKTPTHTSWGLLTFSLAEM